MIKIVFDIDISAEYCLIDVLKTSPRFTAPRESFAVEFVVIKHFGRKSLHVEPSCGLDVEEYSARN